MGRDYEKAANTYVSATSVGRSVRFRTIILLVHLLYFSPDGRTLLAFPGGK
jgi:hypothetical protein